MEITKEYIERLREIRSIVVDLELEGHAMSTGHFLMKSRDFILTCDRVYDEVYDRKTEPLSKSLVKRIMSQVVGDAE